MLKSKNITDEGARILENLFDETISNVTVYLDDAKNELLADSFMCRPVYETWQSVGTIFCGQIGRPLHGIWLASALISVCLMPLIVLLVGIVKYLFKMDKKYDPKRHPASTIQNGGSIYAYEDGSRSSTYTMVSTDSRSRHRQNNQPWCNLSMRKPISPMFEEPSYNTSVYGSPLATAERSVLITAYHTCLPAFASSLLPFSIYLLQLGKCEDV
ncbi:unnamed protein product [Gongylonema pulchrum]|uniref:Protein tweety homolog n=1 Tax=Gongylonema pulchrum TaxID=637853 RepID=A0A183EGP0_9BILA|nr:unnamed protein product [Gongylonema pulchrum]